MTLRTNELGPEEDLGGIGHVVERHSGVAQVVADRAVVPDVALGGDQVLDEIVVAQVGGEGVLDPGAVSSPGLALHARFDAQDVRPVVEVVADPTLGIEQVIDQFGAFVRNRGIEEGVGLGLGGDAAEDIEVDAAHEDLVGGGLGVILCFL